MYNCHADITKFHNLHVSLGTTQRNTMRNRRNANRDRLEKGLKNNDDPSVKKFVSQGSYSMHTMVQDDNHDYDIDDGVVFKKADLVGKNGSDKSALDARKMVRDAVDDGSFNKEPVTLKNCVRIYYNDGPHVDMPVYRELDDETLELASADWKGSSPTEITTWFNDSVIAQSPDEINGRQMRRIVKLLKTFTKSRDSWKSNMPSGFKISVLVDEKVSVHELSTISKPVLCLLNEPAPVSFT